MSAAFVVLVGGFCFFLGLAIVRAARRGGEPWDPALEFGLAYPLGAGALGMMWYWRFLFGLNVIRPLYWAIVCAVAVVLIVRMRRDVWRRPNLPVPLTIVIALVSVLAAALAIFSPYRGGDGIWVHAFKARHMLALGSWADAFFLDPLVVHCNETTPLWTSALLAATSAGGHWSEPWPHLILIPFYPSLLLIVFGALRERVGQAGAAWTAVLIALTPAYGFALGGAGSHYVDVPLSVFFLGAALGVFIFLERNDAGALTVGVLLAFIAIHVKNEGLPVALAVLAPAAVRFVRSSEARARAERAIIAALLLGSTLPFHFIARSFFRTTQSQIWFHDLSAETFVQNVGRVPAILGLTGLEAANTTHWGLWWFLIIAAAVPLIVRRDRPLDTIFLIPGLVVIGSSLGIYWQDYMDFREHIAWSFDRVLLQALPGAVCFTALRAGPMLEAVLPTKRIMAPAEAQRK